MAKSVQNLYNVRYNIRSYMHMVNLHYDYECMLRVCAWLHACLSGCMHNNYYHGGNKWTWEYNDYYVGV